MDVILQLLGRLHPLIVHLPIGFIILGLLIQAYDRKAKAYTPLIGTIYLWAAYAAVMACISGYFQYTGEGYSYDTVKWHLWLGIATAVFCFLFAFRLIPNNRTKFLTPIPVIAFSVALLVLISATGHEGGNITHGSDYLTEPLPSNIKKALGMPTYEKETIDISATNWEEAAVYESVVRPILNNNCVSCHGPKKAKGGLRLHTPEAILAGGDNGNALTPSNPQESLLYAHMALPLEDEDHMPPKDKTQPPKGSLALIEAWISAGASFEATASKMTLKKELFSPFFKKESTSIFPKVVVPAIDQSLIDTIKSQGIHIEQLSDSTNMVRVSCINKPEFTDTDLSSLLPVKEQLVTLDLGGTQVTDALFPELAKFPHLTVLKLDNTAIRGQGIEVLEACQNLRILNLSGSGFEQENLPSLGNIPTLQKAFLFNTKATTPPSSPLKNEGLELDFGEYQLPVIASDSIVY